TSSSVAGANLAVARRQRTHRSRSGHKTRSKRSVNQSTSRRRPRSSTTTYPTSSKSRAARGKSPPQAGFSITSIYRSHPMFKQPPNRPAGVINNLTSANEALTWGEECELSELIAQSIIKRYSGDLEKHADKYETGLVTYTPLDTDDIRDLLTTLWGAHITAEKLEDVFETLTKDGAEHWPDAWCEEDLEYERGQCGRKNNRLDNEIKYVESRLAMLRQERNDLAG